jgi:hypothetical protein
MVAIRKSCVINPAKQGSLKGDSLINKTSGLTFVKLAIPKSRANGRDEEATSPEARRARAMKPGSSSLLTKQAVV